MLSFYNRSLRKLSFLFSLSLCLSFALNVPVAYGQCFNMQSIDAQGTTCFTANHEWEYVDALTNWYAWITTKDNIEDYGLTGYNTFYQRNNILCTRHTVVETQGSDYLQSALKMIPEGRETSIRLGNPYAGGRGAYTYNPERYSIWHPQAEMISFEFTVSAENPIIQFQYAALIDRVYHPMTGSSETPNAQPRIEIYIANSSQTILDPNTTSFHHHGDQTIEGKQGWQQFTRSGGETMYWKDWSTTGFDLTPYIGQRVFFVVENYECVFKSPSRQNFKYCGDHFSYLYFYLDCAAKEIETECLPNRQVRLTAPEGFNYRWYTQGNPSVTLGTTREIVVTADGKTTYCCRLSQKEGMAGSFVLTTKPVCSVLVNKQATVCQEDLPYRFAGKNLTQSGHYEDTVHLTADVDSITALDLTVQTVTIVPTETAYFCTGSSYFWKHGNKTKTLNSAGTYRDTIRYASGCDSARYTLILEERDKIETVDRMDVCTQKLTGYDGFSWNGMWIGKPTDNGKQYTTTSVVSGCDSVVTLQMNLIEELTVYDTIIKPANFPAFKWKGYTISWRGNKETTENAYKFYSFDTTMLTATLECTGTAYLRLFIVEVKDSVEVIDKCADELPFLWRGHNISSASDNGKTYIQKGKNGLDSIKYTLNLSVHPTYNFTGNVTICEGESYPFAGKQLTASGTYTNTFTTAYGCDSTVTLNLTVQKTKTARTERVHLCDGDKYTWEGHGTRFANLSKAGEYRDTARYTTGCDSVYYTLRLTTGDSTIAHLNDYLCYGDSLEYFGQTLKKSGVYRGVTINSSQCDSVIYLHLNVYPEAVVQQRDTNLCAGTPFVWKGHTLTNDGIVYDTLQNKNDCDSLIIQYNVHFLTVTDETVNASICQGKSFSYMGKEYTEQKTYTITDVTPQGCVRNITLNLTVNQPTASDTTAVECNAFTWHGNEYTSSGNYEWHTTNVAGCDSTRTLRLTIADKPKDMPTEYVSICSAGSSVDSDVHLVGIGEGGDPQVAVAPMRRVGAAGYVWEKHEHLGALTQSGMYHDTVLSVLTGCDSIRYSLQLTVNHPTTADTTAVACDSFTWRGKTYTDSGDKVWEGINKAGCDSTVTLHLTINKSYHGDTTAVACDSYTWRGETYTTSGDKEWKGTTQAGCDSIVTLHLTIHKSEKVTADKSVCEGMTYPFGDTILATDGVYTHTFTNRFGCDSTVTLTFTISDVITGDEYVTHCNGEPYWFVDTTITTSGNYQHLFNRVGMCDSLARLHFTVYPAPITHDTTIMFCDGDSVKWHGLTIDSEGEFTYIGKYLQGCDSLLDTLHTVILRPSIYVLDTILCHGQQLSVADTVLKTNGTTTFHLTNSVGCDSILTVNILVQVPDTLKTDSIKIAAGTTYNWQGHTGFSSLSEVGMYYDTLYYRSGCDSVYASLWLDTYAAEVKGAFYVDTVCADDDRIAYRFEYEQGRAVMYDLYYSEQARAQGFKDVLAAAFPDTAVVEWSEPMPKADDDNPLWYVRPEQYGVTLQLTDADNRRTTYNGIFTVLYPSWVILQRWNDVLTITNSKYNGGYEFSKIQWLRNGQEVKGRGDNNAYYYAGDNERLDYNATYSALLTRKDDGKTFATCVYQPASLYEETLLKTPMIKLTPRFAHTSRQIKVESDLDGDYVVYDTSGKRVIMGLFGKAYGSPDIVFAPSFSDGVYLLRFTASNGEEEVIKWVVR